MLINTSTNKRFPGVGMMLTRTKKKMVKRGINVGLLESNGIGVPRFFISKQKLDYFSQKSKQLDKLQQESEKNSITHKQIFNEIVKKVEEMEKKAEDKEKYHEFMSKATSLLNEISKYDSFDKIMNKREAIKEIIIKSETNLLRALDYCEQGEKEHLEIADCFAIVGDIKDEIANLE